MTDHNQLLPCPFCGGKDIDPAGWMRGDGATGPECENCGATGATLESWQARAQQPASVAVPAKEVRKVVTDAMVSMVAGVTGLVPPSGPGAIPDFVQAPIDRAVTQITDLLATHRAQQGEQNHG